MKGHASLLSLVTDPQLSSCADQKPGLLHILFIADPYF